MPRFPWRPALLIVVVAALVGGAIAIQRLTIDRLLREEATAAARAWTEYLATSLADLDAITDGEAPSAESLRFLEQSQKVGQVFRYKIFDAEGRLALVSDELPVGDAEIAGLAEHNATAANAIAAGSPLIQTKAGTPPDRPLYYSEAYIPVVRDGEVTAVVETYIDQTANRARFEGTFTIAAVALGLLVAAAFAIPAAAWYWRRRAHERAAAHITYLSNYDALTGLPNFAQFLDRLTRTIAEHPPADRPLALHSVDIDRFRNLNDDLGLAHADTLLAVAAGRLRAVAGPDDVVARLGGNEFIVLQKAPGDLAGAEAFASRLGAEIAAPIWLDGRMVTITAGIGIAMAPEHGLGPERLIKCARLALAKAKVAGPAQIRVFSADLDHQLNARLLVERGVEVALAFEGFALHFQPLYSRDGALLVGFEALARLPAADGTFVPPIDFIAAAERIGAINRVGAWVLRTACATATAWPENLTVAVNLSPAQFGDAGIVETVAAALKETELDPGRLQLEITENLLLRDTEAVLRELTELKNLGVTIAMDDFGTGYSSLSYLWRFPFDKLKIDASFMRAVETGDPSADKIVRAIAALGRSLDMTVCVEGVETALQAGFVAAVDCDEAQGFYFGRPVPTAEIAAIMLADFNARLPIRETGTRHIGALRAG